MVRCATCGSENDAEARFCSTCGTGLRPVCAACGLELPPAARFCPACGTPVEETVQVPTEERRVVSVLFADVTGSTTLGERLDPEQLRDVMATYFGGMREEIEAEGGTVEKFIGDAVMAAFGVPSAHEDDPARALRAAIRMRRRLEAVNTDSSHPWVTLQMRIGVQHRRGAGGRGRRRRRADGDGRRRQHCGPAADHRRTRRDPCRRSDPLARFADSGSASGETSR